MSSPNIHETDDVHTHASELGRTGKFAELAQLLQTADRLDRAVVSRYLPAIVTNHFFISRRFSGDLFVRWTGENPKWYEPLYTVAEDTERLPRLVDAIWERFREFHDAEIKRLKATPGANR
jgi:hypothetical protein